MNSLEVSIRGPSSPRLLNADITEHRAGMFTPAAKVSVANTTFKSPRWNKFSTKPFHPGNSPAWWDAMPIRSGFTASGLMASGLFFSNSFSAAAISASSRGVTSLAPQSAR